MPVTNFPNGVASFGVPILGSGPIMTTGRIFFVDSDGGNNGREGSEEAPFATIDYAVGRCVPNNGDVIIVKPGHVETITGATSLVVDVAGVTIVGVGQGRTRPVLDFTNTAGTIEMDAANCRLSNFVVRANVSAITVGINVDADDVELDHLYWTFDATGDDFVTMIDITAVDRTYIHDCVFESEDAAGGNEAINLTDTEDVVIENNIFRGNWADAVVQFTTTLSARVVIKNNVMYNSDTSVYNGIDTGTLSSTGVVANNRITALYDTIVTKIYRDGDLTSHNNTFANAVSERGTVLVPVTSAA